jgi:hypothetical protein
MSEQDAGDSQSGDITIPWRIDATLPPDVMVALINPATGSGTALLRDGTFVDVQLEASDASFCDGLWPGCYARTAKRKMKSCMNWQRSPDENS